MGSKQQRNIYHLAMVYFLLSSTSPAADGQIRLTGYGSSRCSGRVEIYYNNTWGTVCDDGWDLNDTEVVCRQLGCGTALSATHSASFGEGTGQIWLDEVACSGTERSVTQCQHRGFGTHNCEHRDDAGVVCSVHLLLLVSSVAAGGLLLLLLVLVVVCLVCKRRRRAKHTGAIVQTQLAVRVRNDSEDNEYEDDEADYVNVDPMDTTQKLKEEAEKGEEEETKDYVEPESDKDHDYEEVDPSASITKTNEVYLSTEEYREEEEGEQEEDNEDDYENVTKPFGEETLEPESDEDHDYEEVDPSASITKTNEVYLSTEEYREEEEGEQEEDNEDDYENVTKPFGEETLEPESDEDHDYEEADPSASIIKTNEVYFSVEENREEAEDNEDDYENVTQPLGEETLDIYGEEDIYQNF